MQNKTNTILLIILIILVAIGVWFLAKKELAPKYNLSDLTPSSTLNKTLEDIKNETETPANKLQENKNIYKSDLGFSFEIPAEFGSVKTNNNGPLVTAGDTGSSFRGYLSERQQNYIFYFAGITKNYTAPREIDCGEIQSVEAYQSLVSKYGEIVNKKGTRYVYANVINNDPTDDMNASHQAAYFKIKSGQFPFLGFCGIGMSESDFKEVVDTVVLN